MTTPTPPAPAPTTPVAAPAAPAPTTPVAAPAAPASTTPIPPPPAPPEPEPEEEIKVTGWPTWATVLVTSTVAIIGMLFVFWLLGAWSFQVRLGEAVDPTPQVVVQTVIVEPTAAMPEATATTEPAKAPEATAQPTAAMPEATAVPPTATAEAPKPTKAAPKPTAPPAPTQVPPTAAPTQVPPTAVPPPAPTAYAYNSYASGSTTAPAGAVCWGDQIAIDGTPYGDGTGPGNPVYTVLSKETSVSLVWGSCVTGEGWETISQRLASDPATKGKTFIKVP